MSIKKWADPIKEKKMTEQKREDIREALNHAVRYKARHENANDIVRNAEKYLKFLEDDE